MIEVTKNAPIYVKPLPGVEITTLVQTHRPQGTMELGDKMILDLAPGALPSCALGTKDQTGGVDMTFLGEATLEIKGNGSTLLPQHDQQGWGQTMLISVLDGDRKATWAGRVHVSGITFLATGGNAIATASDFGNPYSYTPYKEIVIRNCVFKDHPDPNVQCVRPISVNHTALSVYDSLCHMPNSKEHWIYSRNPYNKDTEIKGNTVTAVGGQVLQYVSRTYEGPTYGHSHVFVANNDFRGYHRDPSRAGSAITIAGSGQSWTITDNVVMDLDPPDHADGHTFGGLVVWDGGSFWPRQKTGCANGDIFIGDNNTFVQRNSNRPVLKLGAYEHAQVYKNGISGRDVELHSSCGSLFWSDNNKKEHKDKAIALGAQEEWLTNPPVKRDGVVIGRAHERLSW